MKRRLALAAAVNDTLKQHGYTFCAAESCTGGLLLSTLTDISGSSAVVAGGVVTYSNQAKQQFVGVQHDTLIAHGAVSKATAREMVIGAQRVFSADVAMSITGIAGPGGGTPDKPVGLVYIGLVTPDEVAVKRHIWDGTRLQNKNYSVVSALEWLLDTFADPDWRTNLTTQD